MNSDGEAVKETYRKSGTMILEQWSNDGGTVEQGTVMVEQWNRDFCKWYLCQISRSTHGIVCLFCKRLQFLHVGISNLAEIPLL